MTDAAELGAPASGDAATAERSVARGVAVSTTSQLAAKAVHLGVNVVSTLAVIRYLGPDGYGDYVLALTVTLLIGLVADFGLANVGVREIAQRGDDEHEVLGTLVVLRAGLAVVAMGLAQLVLLALGASGPVHVAAAVVSLAYLGEAVLAIVVVAFHVRLRQQYEAGVRLAMEIAETALLLWLIARGAPMPVLFVPVVLASFGGALVAWLLARRSFGVRLRVRRHQVGPLVRAALPVGPALLIGVAYLKLDSLLLAAFRSSTEVGLYGAAYQPVEYLFLGTAVFVNVLFPLLASSWGEGRRDRFVRLYRRGTETLVAATLVVPVAVVFVAEPLLAAVYGAEYAAAAPALRVLTVVLVLMAVNGWQAFVLLAGGQQAETLRYNLVALALAAVLGVVLVRAFGMVGAASAALGTAVFVLVASQRAVRRRLDVRLDGVRLAKVGASAAGAVAVVGLLRLLDVPWPALVLTALALHPALLLLTGAVRLPELRPEVTG